MTKVAATSKNVPCPICAEKTGQSCPICHGLGECSGDVARGYTAKGARMQAIIDVTWAQGKTGIFVRQALQTMLEKKAAAMTGQADPKPRLDQEEYLLYLAKRLLSEGNEPLPKETVEAAMADIRRIAEAIESPLIAKTLASILRAETIASMKQENAGHEA